jgi:hypothetical protein
MGIIVVLVVALVALPMAARWKLVAAPFLVPAWFAAVGVVTQVVEGSDACAEDCSYTWLYFFAVVTLVIAVTVAAVIAIVVLLLEQRHDRRCARGA